MYAKETDEFIEIERCEEAFEIISSYEVRANRCPLHVIKSGSKSVDWYAIIDSEQIKQKQTKFEVKVSSKCQVVNVNDTFSWCVRERKTVES